MNIKHFKRNLLIGFLAALIILIPAYFGITGYMENRPQLQYTFGDSSMSNPAVYPDTKFAVLSDIHYYDVSLGTTGEAFEKALNSDRKLLKESSDLLNLAVDNIINSGVKFVLVSGDLTKDGEMINHVKVAETLSKLKQKGINICVIPGNHDVNNPGAVKYEGNNIISVQGVSEEQFADIYRNCGYGDAIYRDENSLSYVSEPVKNLWVVAADSTRSRENKPGVEEIVGGKLSQQQDQWLEGVLKKAEQNGKAVIYMEHHGVVEHWKGQSKLHPDYLVPDYKHVGKLLASYGVRLAFTGHYHAQDITRGDFGNDGYLYDIETGSLITAPCTLRYCSVEKNKLDIESLKLVEKYKPGTAFGENAAAFVKKTIKLEAYNTLRKFHVSEKDSDYIGDAVATAFNAHYNGDEKVTDKPSLDTGRLSLWGKLVYSMEKYVIDGLWVDLPPEDNNTVLDLN